MLLKIDNVLEELNTFRKLHNAIDRRLSDLEVMSFWGGSKLNEKRVVFDEKTESGKVFLHARYHLKVPNGEMFEIYWNKSLVTANDTKRAEFRKEAFFKIQEAINNYA